MAKAKDRKRNPSVAIISWIAGFLVVAVVALVLFSEAGARQQSDNSFEAIGAAIGKQKVARKEIARYLDGTPVRLLDKKNHRERFTWGGTLQSYGFELEYDVYDDVARIKPL